MVRVASYDQTVKGSISTYATLVATELHTIKVLCLLYETAERLAPHESIKDSNGETILQNVKKELLTSLEYLNLYEKNLEKACKEEIATFPNFSGNLNEFEKRIQDQKMKLREILTKD